MSTPGIYTAGIQQWWRNATVVVGSGGSGLRISNTQPDGSPGLRLSFEVVKTVEPTPNTATIKIYNLNDDHVAAIQDAYTDIFLNAGYGFVAAQIFVGSIQVVSHYRDGADYITEINCADGDRDYRNAYVNVTLAAGTTDADVVDKIVGNMPSTGKGVIQTLTAKRSRGKVVQGLARDRLDQVSGSNGTNWSIQDGKLHMVRADSKIGTAVVVNTMTGLLEAAERTDKGISAKCLMNPQIVINGAIQLQNEAIRAKQCKPKHTLTQQQSGPLVRLNPDGIYKVIKLTHEGDTRGNDWFTSMVCIGLGQPIPTSGYTTTGGSVPVAGFDTGNQNVDQSYGPTPV